MKRRRREFADRVFAGRLSASMKGMLREWLFAIDSELQEVIHQRDMRQMVAMAEMNEERQSLRRSGERLNCLLLYIRDGGRMPRGWKRLPFEELLAFTETLPGVESHAEMESLPILTKDEAWWVTSAYLLLKKEESEREREWGSYWGPFPVREGRQPDRSKLGGLLFLKGLPSLRKKASDFLTAVQQ